MGNGTCRGQAAVEFLIILLVLMVVFLGFFVHASGIRSAAEDARLSRSAVAVAEHAAGSLNAVWLAGNGASATVSLPETLEGGRSYSASLADHLVEIRWNDSADLRRVQIPLATGSLSGDLPFPGATATARMQDGVIYLE